MADRGPTPTLREEFERAERFAARAQSAERALRDIARELNGLMDSLDDHVIADEDERSGMHEALRQVWLMAIAERTVITKGVPDD